MSRYRQADEASHFFIRTKTPEVADFRERDGVFLAVVFLDIPVEFLLAGEHDHVRVNALATALDSAAETIKR